MFDKGSSLRYIKILSIPILLLSITMLSGCTQFAGPKGDMNKPYNIVVIHGTIDGYLKNGNLSGGGAMCDAYFLYDAVNFTNKSVVIFEHKNIDRSRLKWLVIYSFSVRDPHQYDCPIGEYLWSYSTPSNKKIDLSSDLAHSWGSASDATHPTDAIISLDMSSDGVMISNSKVVYAEGKSNDTMGFTMSFHTNGDPIVVSYICNINYEYHQNWDKHKITLR